MFSAPCVILLATSNAKAAEPLAQALRGDGHIPIVTTTADSAVQSLSAQTPDLAVVWLQLPDSHGGFNLIRAARTNSGSIDPRLPLITVDPSASEFNCLRAFEHGSDDYVDACCSTLQVRARIDALLRRCRDRDRRARLTIDCLEIDVKAHRAAVDGQDIVLSRKEFALLRELASRPGHVFTKAELLRNVWGYPAHLRTRTLDSHACRLRRKLLQATASPCVENVWGVGYRLREARLERHAA